jgi:hypothetical protein
MPPFTAVVLPDEAIAFGSKNNFNDFEIGYNRWLWRGEIER